MAAGCLIAGSFAFHKGLGSMTYDIMVAIGIGGMPVQIALADLDGDGRIDVMCTDTANSELRLYQNLRAPNPGSRSASGRPTTQARSRSASRSPT